MDTARTLEALLLTQPDCLQCHDAETLLTRLAAEYPLTLTLIEAASPAGQAIAERFGLPFSPALVLGGEAFGYGRLSEREVRHAIERQLSPDPLIHQRSRTPAGRVRQALTQFLIRSI